jgi:WD40 repeat protein
VTSGTSAPHYNAGFLQQHQSTREEQSKHGDRLAFAMDMQPERPMLTHSYSDISISTKPDAKQSRTRMTWKDSAWQREDCSKRRSTKTVKPKKIPITPFRVLDAPALRDDFYCSLLAYSPTLHCLAVGLGPHVYLWSEKPRDNPDNDPSKKQLPDSLNTPFGAHVTSLSFSSPGGASAILAIGRADGRITLWSPKETIPRFDSEQPSPISSVCFRPVPIRRASRREPGEMVLTDELLVGDEAGNVYLYSIEWPDQLKRDIFDWPGSMTLLLRIASHSQQICGLA